MQQNWAYRAIGRNQGVWSFGHFDGSSPAYTKSGSFSIREKTSLRGKIYQESDFLKIGWFYCHGTRTGEGERILYYTDRGYKCAVDNASGISTLDDGEGWSMLVSPSVLTDVVDAVYRNSSDETVKGIQDFGRIKVVIDHNGKSEYKEFLVVGEIRNCSMN
ncbi:MAG: hypothetical protein SOT81_04935 [Treponema sp.]|nr:hypothetical protein [Treponema sp.]